VLGKHIDSTTAAVILGRWFAGEAD
jgi:hypothetical protein